MSSIQIFSTATTGDSDEAQIFPDPLGDVNATKDIYSQPLDAMEKGKPPQQAIEACQELAQDDRCQFITPTS